MLKSDSDKVEENTATGLNLPASADLDEAKANASSGSPVPVFEVMQEKCPTCIFGSNRPIKPGRLKQHIKKALRADSYTVLSSCSIRLGRCPARSLPRLL